jgi:hypothetical protein
MKARLGQAPDETQRHSLAEEGSEKRFPMENLLPGFVGSKATLDYAHAR